LKQDVSPMIVGQAALWT